MNFVKNVLCAGPKYFYKLKPEPGPTAKPRPDLQLCVGAPLKAEQPTCL